MYRVLVIDDDAAVRKALRLKLTTEGWECREAGTVAAGLAAARRERPDAVVLDVNLPDGDGIEACRRLKAEPDLAHIRVLLATGEALAVESRTAGLDAGADDYVLKPFSMREVFARLQRLVKAG